MMKKVTVTGTISQESFFPLFFFFECQQQLLENIPLIFSFI